MGTEFTVLKDKMIVTDMRFPAVTGDENWKKIMSAVYVDLSNPDADCLLVFLTFPKVAENTYLYGTIQAKARSLVALCQQSLQQLADEMYGQGKVAYDIDGVYNCQDAAAMVQVAQMAQQKGVGEFDNWPLTATEFLFLMNRSMLVQALIAQAVADQAKANNEAIRDYQGAAIVLPAKEVPQLTFIAAQVPTGCQGKSPGVVPPIGEKHECPAGQVWNPAQGACVTTAIQPTGGDQQAKKTSRWVTPVAIVGGLAVAGGLAFLLTKGTPKPVMPGVARISG